MSKKIDACITPFGAPRQLTVTKGKLRTLDGEKVVLPAIFEGHDVCIVRREHLIELKTNAEYQRWA